MTDECAHDAEKVDHIAEAEDYLRQYRDNGETLLDPYLIAHCLEEILAHLREVKDGV